MIVRSKTKVRLLILLAALAVLIGGGATLYFVRKQRLHNYYVAQRAIGMDQYQKGDYVSALVKLGPYIRREEFSRDAEAIYAFAEARRKVEMPNGRHLAQAMTTLQRVLSLQPGRSDVQRELLDLYTQLGYNIEACELAEKLLHADKNDLQALRASARGFQGRQMSKEARDACGQVIALVPLDLEMHVLSLEIHRDLGERPEILKTALDLLAKHPNDPKAELILSIACSFMEEMTEVQRKQIDALIKEKYPNGAEQIATLMKKNHPNEAAAVTPDPFTFSQFFAIQAANRDLSDLVLVRYLLQQLDRTRQVNESLAVLKKVDIQQTGSWVRQFLIRRLWETGRYTDVLKRMEKMEIFGSTPSDIELLAIRGIAEGYTDHKDDAAKTANTLANFKDDRIAQAWAAIIQELVLKTDGNARQVIEAIRLAFEVQRNNAYLRFYQGVADLRLGERDAAIEAFSQVAAASPLWQLPMIHLSRLMLDAGQTQSALEYAYEAWRINSTGSSLSNLLIIIAANTNLTTIDAKSDLFIDVQSFQKKNPGEESTLPLYVQLLAKTNQPDEAKKVINNSIAAETPPAANTLLHLAAVSRASNLGLHETCYAAAEKSAGLTPQIALARATSMAEAGKTADAARYFQESMQKLGAADTSWRLAWATFLEQTKDSRAAATWLALADDPALKSTLDVQRDALSAPSIQKDTAFLTRTIERIRAVAGEQAIGWKMARAQLFLRDPVKAKSPDVIKLLSDVIAGAPNNIEARVMLASAYEKSEKPGNISAAIEQLTAARKLQPSSQALKLDLARLYMVQLDFQRARELVGNIRPEALQPAQRRAAARILGQQGNITLAIEFMEGAMADAPSLDRLYLAELYRRSDKHEKADAIYKSLLEKPDRIEVVMAAADYYASRGQNELALQTLASLEKLQLKPAEKDYALAEFSSRHGKADQALERYLAVVQSDPTKPNGWRSLINEYIRAGKPDEAVQAARDAIRALPADAARPFQFQNVVSSAATLKELAPEKTLVGLMQSVMEPAPDGEVAFEVLPIIAEGIRTNAKAEDMTTRLRDIADRAPNLAALQMLLVQNYLICGNAEEAAGNRQKAAGHREEAAKIALRSLSVAPSSPEIAKNAALAVYATRNWAKALAPAQQWQALTPENTLPADLFIAELHFGLEDYASVLRVLQPHAEKARANPKDKELAFVNTFRAQALLMRGDEAAAADLLGPMLATNPQTRAVWRGLTQFLPNPIAQKWIERLAAATPADAVNEQADLAIAWSGLFAGRPPRFAGSNDPSHKQAALAILDRLATAAPDHPLVIRARAIVAQAFVMRGDEAAAADLLGPMLATQPPTRAVWRGLTQLLPNPIAQKWIERLAAATPADQVSEQIDLAIAWHGLFAGRPPRFAGSNDPKHREAAVAILDRLATTAPDHPLVIQARAILAQGENRPGAAEQGYRRALELKPDLPVSLNNLAMMVCDRGDHKEALSLAQRAVTASPGDPSIRDTLAYVQLKLKDYPKALESLKTAATLDPKNIKRRIKLAQAYDEANQIEDLRAILDEIEKMMPDAKVEPEQLDTIRQLRSKVPKTALR